MSQQQRILVLLLRSRRPLSARDCAELTEISENACRVYLRRLFRQDRIEKHFQDGTRQGRPTVLFTAKRLL